MPTEPENDFAEWCIVELFGHTKIAGWVTSASLGGCSFLRVDVPNPDGEDTKYTRYLGQGAIYAINVTTREEVLRLITILYPRPNVPIERQQRLIREYDDDGDGDDKDF